MLAPVKGYDNSTPRKVKEALFQMVENQISSYEKTLFYDLFAGSGQLGIEALSRGAFFTCFYEIDQARLSHIKKWLADNGEKNHTLTRKLDAFRHFSKFLQEPPLVRKSNQEKAILTPQELPDYDLVLFADPPYRSREGEKAPPLILLESFFSTAPVLPMRSITLFIQGPSEKSGIHRHEISRQEKQALEKILYRKETAVHNYGNHRIITAIYKS